MSATEITKSLQFRSQAMVFASSSLGKKLFTVKEEVGFNFKKTFRKPNEKITANKSKRKRNQQEFKYHQESFRYQKHSTKILRKITKK